MKSCKSYLFFSSAFYPIMCLLKSTKNFEKIAILEIWQLVFFRDVKIHFGEKYAWFVIEILIHWHKSCLWDMLWPQKILIDISQSTSSENHNYQVGNRDENEKFHSWKCIFSGVYFTEVCFYTSEGNQLSYFQNGYCFKILWWFHEAHNWVKCQ